MEIPYGKMKKKYKPPVSQGFAGTPGLISFDKNLADVRKLQAKGKT